MRVDIFTTKDCPYCGMLKQFLREHQVEYNELKVDEDEDARKKMEEISEGFLGVPFTVIKHDDGTEEKIIGFDKAKFEQLIT